MRRWLPLLFTWVVVALSPLHAGPEGPATQPPAGTAPTTVLPTARTFTALVSKPLMNSSTNATASGAAGNAGSTNAPALETVYLAGGCFWGMEEILRNIPGVKETQAGYTGGWLPNPKYDDTHDSKSGHAESVKVVFDPTVLPLEELLEKWFFRMHDPTTLNRQGNDVGSQYRSAIFTFNEAQKKTATVVKARVNASGKWRRPVVTEIADASTWYPAEGYHQKYLLKNPGGYSCHYLRD